MGDSAASFTLADGYRALAAEHEDHTELASLETKLLVAAGGVDLFREKLRGFCIHVSSVGISSNFTQFLELKTKTLLCNSDKTGRNGIERLNLELN